MNRATIQILIRDKEKFIEDLVLYREGKKPIHHKLHLPIVSTFNKRQITSIIKKSNKWITDLKIKYNYEGTNDNE